MPNLSNNDNTALPAVFFLGFEGIPLAFNPLIVIFIPEEYLDFTNKDNDE